MDSEVEKKLGRNPQGVTDIFSGKKEKSASRDAWGSCKWLQKDRGEQQQRAWGNPSGFKLKVWEKKHVRVLSLQL